MAFVRNSSPCVFFLSEKFPCKKCLSSETQSVFPFSAVPVPPGARLRMQVLLLGVLCVLPAERFVRKEQRGNPGGQGGPQVPPEPATHLGGLSGPPRMESFHSQPLPPRPSLPLSQLFYKLVASCVFTLLISPY